VSPALVSVLAGIAGMFGWGLYDFLGGVYAKRIGPSRSFFWSQMAGLASALVLAFFIGTRLKVPSLVAVLLPIAVILYSAGYLFFFRGLEIGNISIVAATMNLWAVFTMLFAFIFLGQRLSTTQSFGVMLILSGVTLASADWGNVRHQGFRLSSGVKEAVLGAFFFGVFWNISEVISEAIGWLSTTLLGDIVKCCGSHLRRWRSWWAGQRVWGPPSSQGEHRPGGHLGSGHPRALRA